MRSLLGVPKRALIAVACTAAALSAGVLNGAATASAHVHADADKPAPGAFTVVTFQVPGESEKGTLTTRLSVKLPDVASARTEVMPGWTGSLDRDTAAGTFRSVTWTADPKVGISSDQFALFRVSVKLPDADSVAFPTTQTYSDGTVVRWAQPPLPGGGEPDHPAPMISLTGAAPSAMDDHEMTARAAPSADNTARWLAGGAILLAAAGVAAVVVARRST